MKNGLIQEKFEEKCKFGLHFLHFMNRIVYVIQDRKSRRIS